MDRDLASRQQARELISRTRTAFEGFRHASQEQVDQICQAMVEAGFQESRRLGQIAVEETGFGDPDGKTAKNQFATRGLWDYIGDLATCGLIRSDEEHGVYDYADPFGVIAGIIPTTNPTSTALFKAIISVKARNGMVCSPHPNAVECIAESIRVVHDAAVSAGAPKDLVTCMTSVTLDGTEELMRHEDVDLILATGGSGLVRAAYSSGKPAFGVGPGNSPCYVDRSADLGAAAAAIIDSQTFDNGTICASEQSLVLDSPIRDEFLREAASRGAYMCPEEDAEKLEKIVVTPRGGMNPAIVGRYAWQIAEMAGISIPEGTEVILADCHGVGREHPLSIEKLSPILAVFTEDGWEAGCDRCIEVLRYGGMGHTMAIHCSDDAIIHEFAEKKPVNRMVVNSPASQGAVGLTTHLAPSMTLGCGSFGGNITSDNIGPLHLLNIKRLAYVRSGYGTPSWDVEYGGTGPRVGETPVGKSTTGGGASAWNLRQQAKSTGDGAPQLWRPKPLAPDEGGVASPSDLFSAEDLRQIVERMVAHRTADECPFGKCADCPPLGESCEKAQVSPSAPRAW